MLGYDVHAEHYPLLREIVETSRQQPLRRAALRLLAADSGVARTDAHASPPTRPRTRRAAPPRRSRCSRWRRDDFDRVARTVVLDDDEDDDVRATVISAITHGPTAPGRDVDAQGPRARRRPRRHAPAQPRRACVHHVAHHAAYPPLMDVEALVAEVRADPARRDELLPLLHEGHPAYDGRGESAALRTRGWVMAAYESVGLPPEAVPAVLETLRTGLDPFASGRGRSCRPRRRRPRPGPGQGARGGAGRDARPRRHSVSFAGLRPRWPDPESTTALTEVLRTLRALGSAAHDVHGDLIEARRLHAGTWSPAVRAELDAAIEATARAPPDADRAGAVPVPLHPSPPAARTSGASCSRTRRDGVRPSGSCSAGAATSSRSSTPAAATPRSAPRPSPGSPRWRPGCRRRCPTRGSAWSGSATTPATTPPSGWRRTARPAAWRSPTRCGCSARRPATRCSASTSTSPSGTPAAWSTSTASLLYVVGGDTRTSHAWTRVTWTVDEVLDVLTAPA